MNRVLTRIWIDVTGIVMPLIVMAAYVLEWSAPVRAVLTALFVAGVFSTVLLTDQPGRRRWRRHARRERALRRAQAARRRG